MIPFGLRGPYYIRRWYSLAQTNHDEWGEQSIETLLLATQEELGELCRAHLEYHAEDGEFDRLREELDDLAPLMIQLHEAIQRERRSA